MTEGVTERITNYVADAQWSDLPDALRHEAKRSLLNHFAAGFAGCGDDAVERLIKVLVPLSGPSQATLIGRVERLDLLNGAFMNAVISNVFDFDDTHLRTVIHPTAPIAPALFALSESRKVSGAELLNAFALGVDVACRIGNAISPGHYGLGWHITGTCGILGSSLAAGKLIGLDARKLKLALGAAATQAAGLVETLGFDAKSLNVGNAARGGLLAALLAEQGFTGPEQPLEGARGFLKVLGGMAQLGEITDGLGSRSELALNTYKPYPCGVVLHPVIDACLDLRTEAGFDVSKITRVVVSGNPLLKARADRRVTTGREAQVCLGHTVAVALRHGRAGVGEYTDAAVNDPANRTFSELVAIEVDDAIPVEAARVAIETSDGGARSQYVQHARGSIGRPMSDTELETKLRDLAAPHLPVSGIAKLIDTVWALDRLEDASVVIKLAARKIA